MAALTEAIAELMASCFASITVLTALAAAFTASVLTATAALTASGLADARGASTSRAARKRATAFIWLSAGGTGGGEGCGARLGLALRVVRPRARARARARSRPGSPGALGPQYRSPVACIASELTGLCWGSSVQRSRACGWGGLGRGGRWGGGPTGASTAASNRQSSTFIVDSRVCPQNKPRRGPGPSLARPCRGRDSRGDQRKRGRSGSEIGHRRFGALWDRGTPGHWVKPGRLLVASWPRRQHARPADPHTARHTLSFTRSSYRPHKAARRMSHSTCKAPAPPTAETRASCCTSQCPCIPSCPFVAWPPTPPAPKGRQGAR